MTNTEIQQALIKLGYKLPKYGADGDIGPETLAALAKFADDRGLSRALAPADYAPHLASATANAFAPIDITRDATKWKDKARRAWSAITGITLHQTACVLGDDPARWRGLDAHIGVTRGGKSLLVCPLDRVVWHGNLFNGPDVGVEIDGYYEGIEGNRRTLWNPPTDPGRAPLVPTAEQIAASRAVVRWIIAEVARNGGRVKYIHAHRQASNMRQSDPGSRIWRDVGVWAQRELGLSDGGDGYRVGTGLAIPREWDDGRSGRY